jgi:hypothetical protein
MPLRSTPGTAYSTAPKATPMATTTSRTDPATDSFPAATPPRMFVAVPVWDALAMLRTGW